MGRVTTRRPVLKVRPDSVVRRPDTLAVEEPLELRIDHRSLVVTMRTPGADVDLAHGFLLGEGIIGGGADVITAQHCFDSDLNVLEIQLGPEATPPTRQRTFVATSACGVCGKESIEDVRRQTRWPLTAPTPQTAPLVAATTVLRLPDLLREAQAVFDKTGGLHAAGLFTAEGTLLAVREDVGRHNAVDKVIGWAVREGLTPLHEVILMVSGRASFELVQKAVMAGIPVLAAVSAPSSLAADLAEETGLTLAGFVRGSGMNVYTWPERIDTGS
ncbi:formate dehydrogenase accessory sulfurtransferase FdhD [Nocardioides sp.]|uniref:formate dehydrogenase accessory sulfurtransferase FdhD n=1 Tax=Nocardioides sp. TaxID=35761 RepID=UPI002614FCAA|nr:formate dehydrogenase accessory sulfurtransferase FdhD [Nocardioides sp.]